MAFDPRACHVSADDRDSCAKAGRSFGPVERIHALNKAGVEEREPRSFWLVFGSGGDGISEGRSKVGEAVKQERDE